MPSLADILQQSQQSPQAYAPQPDTGILRINRGPNNPDYAKYAEIEHQLHARGKGAGSQLKEAIRYVQGLPLNYEGMADAFSLKYGAPALKHVIEVLPHLNPSAIMELAGYIEQAGSEHDAMRDRERQKGNATRGIQTQTSYPPSSLADILGQQPR